ncbi:hypothetical protein [Actinopolymorpha cephalotaxi]|uniref:Uncharacterized protein n=1 Tax=Actinopolymorpha cephalotaxi TaxID=504797 RepID=A0ABX2S9M0_9ACTN|nr:hypothetical protein [Actinopolymorpha cephalotaxi]NYH86349.1 hypothetical protein [Actinopolymorpha cephalotaxi]
MRPLVLRRDRGAVAPRTLLVRTSPARALAAGAHRVFTHPAWTTTSGHPTVLDLAPR